MIQSNEHVCNKTSKCCVVNIITKADLQNKIHILFIELLIKYYATNQFIYQNSTSNIFISINYIISNIHEDNMYRM